MSDVYMAPRADGYTVGLAAGRAVGWLGIAFAAFIAPGVYLLLASGHYTVDDEGITQRNAFGLFRMRWSNVRKIEAGSGVLILVGDDSRFVIMPPGLWSGSEKSAAWALLAQKLNATGLPVVPSRTAAYKGHRNVRVIRQ